jgi:undecaprenyl-diphosphatase
VSLLAVIVVLGIVEGLTEFLPVSSTGHLILASHLLGYKGAEADSFGIFIQSGAILAVVATYFRRFVELVAVPADRGFHNRRGLGMIMLTTTPILLLGKLLHDPIKAHMTPGVVAIGLALGAIWILLAEHVFQMQERRDLDGIGWRTALGIGLFQCLALWPGMSRASSTILGGMMLGLQRKAATEYSFFAAVPALCAACLYDLYKSVPHLHMDAVPRFALGFVVSFVAAFFAIRFLIRFVSHHTLSIFGWYRLLLAGLVWLVIR